jgi:hypothetical protein
MIYHPYGFIHREAVLFTGMSAAYGGHFFDALF